MTRTQGVKVKSREGDGEERGETISIVFLTSKWNKSLSFC